MADSLYKYSIIAARNSIFSVHSQAANDESLVEHVHELFDAPFVVRTKVCEEVLHRQPKILLQITISEAENLTAMDANGLSDPYCYLFLTKDVQINYKDLKRSLTPSSSPLQTPNGSPKLRRNRSSCHGSSFRGLNGQSEIISTNKTDVQFKTLNPKWNHTFEFELNEINNKVLILHCYDFDNESSNVLANITEKNSFKGVFKSFRHFLENRKIADDFLGQIRISLNDIHEPIVDKWYDLLCKHNNKSHKTKGRIHVVIKLNVQLNELDFDNNQNSNLNKDTPDIVPTTDVAKKTYIEEYHRLLRIVYKKTFQSIENMTIEWDGTIHYASKTLLKRFRDTYMIGDMTKSIIELVALLEMTLDYPNMINDRYLAIKIDNLYAATQNDESFKFNDYEIKVFHEATSLYIRGYLENHKLPLFPPEKDNQKLIDNIKFLSRLKLILNAICKHEQTDYQTMVAETLIKNLQDDTTQFILDRISINKTVEMNEAQLLNWMDNITAIMSDLVSYSELMAQNETIFKLFNIDYCKIAAISISTTISRPVQFVLKSLNEYQTEYRRFTANMKKASKVACKLFMYCRELCDYLVKWVPKRELFKLQIVQYPIWFKEQSIFSFCLETYRIISKDFIINALKLEDVKEISNENNVGISMTSILVAQHLITICKEWNELQITDIETRYHGVVILTEIIIDACRLFVRTLKSRLEQLNYYFESESLNLSQKQVDPIRKICICMNNIDYIKVQTISSLSSLLKYEEIAHEIEDAYNDSSLSQTIIKMLEKSIAEAMKDMDALTSVILENMTSLLIPVIRAKVLAFYEKKNATLIDYLHKTLHLITTKMPHYSKMLITCVWNSFIKLMNQHLPLRENYLFYQHIEKELQTIEHMFISYDLPFNLAMRSDNLASIDASKIIEESCHTKRLPSASNNEDITDLDKLSAKLRLMSMPTEKLIIDHLKFLIEPKLVSPCSTNVGSKNASIYFKVAYEEESKATNRININIMYCKNIPVLDTLTNSSDPFVRVELLPKSLFPSASVKETNIVYRRLNPYFDETFTFPNVPKDVMKLEGACIRLSVWDYDMVGKNDFAGETFYQLMHVESMDQLVSINAMPVILHQLNSPLPNELTILEEIKRRSEFDSGANEFLKSRMQAIEAYTEPTNPPSGCSGYYEEDEKQKTKSPIFKILNKIKCFPKFKK